jgi:hypothetical protein
MTRTGLASLIRFAFVHSDGRTSNEPMGDIYALLRRFVAHLSEEGQRLVEELDRSSTGALQAAENGWRFDAAQKELALLAQLATRAGIRPPRTFSDDEAAWALRQEWEPIAQVVSHQLLRTAILSGTSLSISCWAKEAMTNEPEAVALALRGRDEAVKQRWYELVSAAIAAQDLPQHPVIAFNAVWQITACPDSVTASVVSPIFLLDPGLSQWAPTQVPLDAEDPLVIVEDGSQFALNFNPSAGWLEDSRQRKWNIAGLDPVGESLVGVAEPL